MHACIHSFVECIHSLCYQETTTILFFIHIRKQQKKNPIHCILSANRKQQKKIIHFNLSVIRKQQQLDLEASLPEVFGRLGVLFLRITAPSAAASAVQAPTTTKTTTSSVQAPTTAAELSSGAQTPGTHSQKLREREGGGDHGRERGREEERKRGREKSGTHSEKYPTCYDYRVLHSEDTRALTYANLFLLPSAPGRPLLGAGTYVHILKKALCTGSVWGMHSGTDF